MNDKSKVLIVDDSIENRRMLAAIIGKNTDYEVLLANSGKAVFKDIESYKPDIILLDIVMPEMDGYEVIKKLKGNPILKEIPVLFITGLEDINYKIKGFEMGGVDFVSKPFNDFELIARVKTHVKLKKTQDELLIKNKLLADREVHLLHLVEKKTKKIKDQFYTDSLTKLPNRHRLIEDVKNVPYPALILINIDNFKEINNFYGTNIGDMIIIELGKRLGSVIEGSKYILYKLHADEYAVLAQNDNRFEDLFLIVKELHDKGEKQLYVYQDQKIPINVSMGIARGIEKIFEKADMALKYVKSKKIHYYFYDDSLQIKREYENNLRWTQLIKNAIEKNRIIPFFQPIVNTKNNEIEIYEALARLIDENGRIHTPYQFLQVAKKSKQYAHITRAIIDNSIYRFTDTDLKVSINLSVEDVLNNNTVDYIECCLKENSIGRNVIFEIIESEGIERYDDISNFINKVKAHGCKIAIDDFGTGYSNFAHILKLEVDYIKIDSTLIKEINKNRNSQIVVGTIVDFCKQLGIKTIAEFVHSRRVYKTIAESGIDYAQGYYLGEPREEIPDRLPSKVA